MNRLSVDPDGSHRGNDGSVVAGHRDPPEALFSLNHRQLELLRARQQQGSVAGGNKLYYRQSIGVTEKTETKSDARSTKSSVSFDESSIAAARRSSTMTPIRTPNPVSRVPSSRSTSSASDDQQRAFLRSMLQKAASKNSGTATSLTSEDQTKKALVRRVLARTVTSNKTEKPHTAGASRSAKSYSSKTANQFRDRIQKAAKMTPTQRKALNKVKSSLSLSSSKKSKVSKQVESHHGEDPLIRRRVNEKLRQKTFKRESLPSESVPVGVDEPSNDDFEVFMNNLQQEASEQHSALWQSFSAVIQGAEAPTRYPPRTKKEKHTFDNTTRKTIQKLNGHLRKHSGVERTGATELVNDSKFYKARTNTPPLQSLSKNGSIVSVSSIIPQSSKESDRIIQMRSSGDSSLHSTPMSNVTRAVEKLRARESMPRAQDPATIEESRSNDHEQNAMLDGASDPGVEVTLGQFQCEKNGQSITSADSPIVKRTASNLLSGGSLSSSRASWSSVQLRPITSSAPSSPPNSSGGSSVPSWASMRLRPIQKKSTDTTIAEDDTFDESSSGAPSISKTFSSTSGTSSKPIAIEGDTLDVLNVSEIEKTFSGCETKPIMVQTPLVGSECNADNEKDEIVSLREVYGGNEDVVSFDLLPPVGCPASFAYQILVSKTSLAMVQVVDGETQIVVKWRLSRDNVSCSLDMATQKVVITEKNGSTKKTVSFTSSDDSLRFANELHNMKAVKLSETAPVVKTKTSQPEIIDVTGGDIIALHDLDGSAVDGTNSRSRLSEEEQALLDKFRMLRQTRTAVHAMEETLSTGNGSQPSVLTPGEEVIAEKYRKMLRMNIPIESVRHKLEIDCASESIISSVLGEGNGAPPHVVDTLADLPSSPISTFSSSVAPSDDVELVQKYRKMLSMGIPQDAVRHKMQQDQVDSSIQSAVFGEIEPTTNAPSTKLSMKDEIVAEKYRKMLKLSVPAEAVRHKMKQDQISEIIVSAVLPTTDSRPCNLSKEESAVAAKYTKMLSLRIPVEAVKHSMTKDHVDAKIVEAVLGHRSQGGDETHQQHDAVKSRKPGSLDAEEQSVASQYKKLLKLQIPREKVFQRMQQEGVSEKIIKAVIGRTGLLKTNSTGDQSTGGGSKYIALHWTPLDGSALEDSIWGASRRKGDDSVQPEESEISKLIHLFQKKSTKKVLKEREADADQNGSTKAKLLDVTRSNNVAISLKAFKDFSCKELAQIIAFLDPLQKIRGDRILFLRDLLPTITEAQLVLAYSGSDERLAPAEIWFRHVSAVPRMDTKVQVMRSMETLQAEAISICENFRTLSRAASQVMENDKLVSLLEMVLSVGNIMNEGTRTGGAAGFKFDSLQRLTQTKSSDGKTTVLDFLVTVYVAKGNRENLNLLSDLTDCQVGSRMLISDMTNDVKSLRESLNECKKEYEAMKNDLNAEATRLKEDRSSSPANTTFSQREKFLEALKSQNQTRESSPTSSSGDEDHSQVDDKTNTLACGVERLEKFIAEAEQTISNLETEKDEAVETSKSLSKYCGEGGGPSSAPTLLGIVHQFAVNVDLALKKYDRQKLTEEKKQKRQESNISSQSSTSSSSTSTLQPVNTEGKSLVLLVNEMLNDANGQTKEDFRKGRTYTNPSQRLQLIYEKEQKQAVTFGSPATAVRKMGIVSAIREREGRIDKAEVLESRSKYARIVDGIESKRETDLESPQTSAALSELKYHLFGKRSPKKMNGDKSKPTEKPTDSRSTTIEPMLSKSMPSQTESDHGVAPSNIEIEKSVRPTAVLERAKQFEQFSKTSASETSSDIVVSVQVQEQLSEPLLEVESPHPTATPAESEDQETTIEIPSHQQKSKKLDDDSEISSGILASVIDRRQSSGEVEPSHPEVTTATTEESEGQSPANENSSPPPATDGAFHARSFVRELMSGEKKSRTASPGILGMGMSREELSKANSDRRKSLTHLAYQLNTSFDSRSASPPVKPAHPKQSLNAASPPAKKSLRQLATERRNSRHTDTPQDALNITLSSKPPQPENGKPPHPESGKPPHPERTPDKSVKTGEKERGPQNISPPKTGRLSISKMAAMKRKGKKGRN